ncbi:hypothetical protein FA95DRAFT_1612867 [Auriscalpium vulgare]|uniref:Uncharacterized protein n=1 Tax=Auriscalpium vulgare TaxID=40419 RepID=A0ACB8R5A7_9AGAM|nr:hypothetical protein FA95DRAFT_1612867 [Auriscalpium vulgare]
MPEAQDRTTEDGGSKHETGARSQKSVILLADQSDVPLVSGNTRLLRDVADLHNDVDSLREQLRDAEDDMHRARHRKVSPPSPDAHAAPSTPLADRLLKVPLADRMAPATGQTLLTPGEDGSTRHTFLPAHTLQSDQARFNISHGLPPPLGHTPVGGRDTYLADTDPATIAAVDSLFARARQAPASPAATKARYFMHRISLTPTEFHTAAIKHVIATWTTGTAVEHAPQETTDNGQHTAPPSKKRGSDKARPSAQQSPHTWRHWLVTHPDARYLRQHTRGVGTSDDFPMRNVRGYVAALRLAPPRGKARSSYMLSAAAIFGIPQAYREALERSGEEVASTRHDTPMAVDYDPTREEVVTHLACNGVTLAEADDYWAWGQEFISTYVSDVLPSAKHPARVAYDNMNTTPHLLPTLGGFPDDHEATFNIARDPLPPLDLGELTGHIVDGPADGPVDAPSPRF